MNDIPLETLPNTTVTVHHLPDMSDHCDAVGFHDTSLTTINFVPTSENTTVVNIHPPPRIRTTPFIHRNAAFSSFIANNTIEPLDDTVNDTIDNTLDETIDPTDPLNDTQLTRF